MTEHECWMRAEAIDKTLKAWDSMKQQRYKNITAAFCEVCNNKCCRSGLNGDGVLFTLQLGWTEGIGRNGRRFHRRMNRMTFGREAPPGLIGASCRIRDVRLIEDPSGTVLLAVTPDLDTMRPPEARGRWSFANRSLYVQIFPDDLKKMEGDILKEEGI